MCVNRLPEGFVVCMEIINRTDLDFIKSTVSIISVNRNNLKIIQNYGGFTASLDKWNTR